MDYKAPEKVKQYISTSFSHAYYYYLPLRCLTSPHHYLISDVILPLRPLM